MSHHRGFPTTVLNNPPSARIHTQLTFHQSNNPFFAIPITPSITTQCLTAPLPQATASPPVVMAPRHPSKAAMAAPSLAMARPNSSSSSSPEVTAPLSKEEATVLRRPSRVMARNLDTVLPSSSQEVTAHPSNHSSSSKGAMAPRHPSKAAMARPNSSSSSLEATELPSKEEVTVLPSSPVARNLGMVPLCPPASSPRPATKPRRLYTSGSALWTLTTAAASIAAS